MAKRKHKHTVAKENQNQHQTLLFFTMAPKKYPTARLIIFRKHLKIFPVSHNWK